MVCHRKQTNKRVLGCILSTTLLKGYGDQFPQWCRQNFARGVRAHGFMIMKSSRSERLYKLFTKFVCICKFEGHVPRSWRRHWLRTYSFNLVIGWILRSLDRMYLINPCFHLWAAEFILARNWNVLYGETSNIIIYRTAEDPIALVIHCVLSR